MNLYKELIIKEMEFTKVNDYLYNAHMNEDKFLDMITDIVKGFTVCEDNTFSPIMDIPLSEEIISRIVADAFVFNYRNVVEDTDSAISINFTIGELTYKISIANNQDKLGGIIYGSMS